MGNFGLVSFRWLEEICGSAVSGLGVRAVKCGRHNRGEGAAWPCVCGAAWRDTLPDNLLRSDRMTFLFNGSCPRPLSSAGLQDPFLRLDLAGPDYVEGAYYKAEWSRVSDWISICCRPISRSYSFSFISFWHAVLKDYLKHCYRASNFHYVSWCWILYFCAIRFVCRVCSRS